LKEFVSRRVYQSTDDGKFIPGPEVLLLTCKITDTQVEEGPQGIKLEAIELTPVTQEFSSLGFWVRFDDLNSRVQSKVENGAPTGLNLELTFDFDGTHFTRFSTIVDGASEVTCFSTKESALQAAPVQ